MGAELANLLYLVSGVLFILALRGLSHPTTSRQGNMYGMIGNGHRRADDAVYAPGARRLADRDRRHRHRRGIGALSPSASDDGDAAARRGFQSLVGLAAVLVAAAALYARSLRHRRAGRSRASLFEMALGAGNRAVTFTGSIILPEARRAHVRQADHAALADM